MERKTVSSFFKQRLNFRFHYLKLAGSISSFRITIYNKNGKLQLLQTRVTTLVKCIPELYEQVCMQLYMLKSIILINS